MPIDSEAPAPTQRRPFLTIPEIASDLNLCRTTAYDLARRNALPAPVIRVGRRMYIGAKAWDQAMSAGHSTTDRPEGADRDN